MRPVDGARQIMARRRSRHAELHWIPRASQAAPRKSSALPEYAVINRELGERDWTAVDPLRVRTSKGIRHRSTPAMYYWHHTRSHVWCESQEERWEVLWLDYGSQVSHLWAQPGAITFGHGSRLSGHWHVPDFLAQFTDGTYGLFDVRPIERVDARARLQFDETAKVCAALGWQYGELPGHDPLATRNLDYLSASRHDRCRPTESVGSLILKAAQGGQTRSELCRIASPECPPLACAWVDNLAWRQLLKVDLAAVFSSDTVFVTSELIQDGVAADD